MITDPFHHSYIKRKKEKKRDPFHHNYILKKKNLKRERERERSFSSVH